MPFARKMGSNWLALWSGDKHVSIARTVVRTRQRALYGGQDQIDDAQWDELIQGLEKQLKTEHRAEPVFTLRWSMIWVWEAACANQKRRRHQAPS